jgi:transcription-repair coupling factor (superfamily II helicase)
MEDINQRLVFYRRFSTARSEEEVEEIAEELRDRYGPIPPVLENLLEVMNLKLLLKKAGVRHVSTEKGKVVLAFDAHSPVDPTRLVAIVAQAQGKQEFTPQGHLRFRLEEKGWGGIATETKKLLMDILGNVNIKN